MGRADKGSSRELQRLKPPDTGELEAAQVADAAMALLECRSAGDVWGVAADFVGMSCPGAVVIVNEATPDLEWLITRRVSALNEAMLLRAAGLVGFEVIGKRSAVSPVLQDALLGGTLTKIPGGFAELAESEIPRALGAIASRAFGLRDVFTIGITDGHTPLGNIHILTRLRDATVPAAVIESFARRCHTTLTGIASAERLAERAQVGEAAIDNMVEGFALCEIMLGDDGEPHDYRYLRVNAAFEAIVGATATDLVGRSERELFPANAQTAIEELCAVAVTGVPTQFEMSSTSIGRHIWATAYSPQSGRFVMVLSDVTDRILAEEAVRDSRDMLVNLTDQVPGVVVQFRLHADGGFSFPFASRGMNDIFEYAAEDLMTDAAPAFARVHPEDLERLLEGIQESARTLEPFHGEFRVVLPRQGLRWRLSDGIPHRMEDGGTLWHGIISDVTDRKMAEQALRESEDRLQLALSAARAGTWEWDVVTGENTWSDELWGLYGLDRGAFDASYDSWLASVRSGDRARLEEHVGGASASGAPIAFEWQVNGDGSDGRWLMSRGRPVKDEHGGVLRYRGIVVDITERKQAEDAILRANAKLEDRVRKRTEELTAANDELRRATRAKDEFVASMSHELRTPLNSIIGFSGVLLQGLAGPLNDEQAVQIGMVEASGKHLLSLVDEVLDLSRIEAGKTAPVIDVFQVVPLATTVLEMVRPLADAKGLALSLVCGPEITTLESDPRFVSQILTNLMGNAVKFTSSGDVYLGVTIEDESMVLAVTDTGRGIPAADLPHIMERFYQAEALVEAKNEGTGLGLAISQRLADAIGGSLDVRSEVGVGTTVTLRVPCATGLSGPESRRRAGGESHQ
jgi:PAS domain S-box-containing protein